MRVAREKMGRERNARRALGRRKGGAKDIWWRGRATDASGRASAIKDQELASKAQWEMRNALCKQKNNERGHVYVNGIRPRIATLMERTRTVRTRPPL